MPLNQRTLKARSEPTWQAHIDHRSRIPLPPGIDWTVGMRVYFSLKKTEPSGIVLSQRPAGLHQGRLLSSRIRQIPLTRPAPMRRTPARRPPRSRT